MGDFRPLGLNPAYPCFSDPVALAIHTDNDATPPHFCESFLSPVLRHTQGGRMYTEGGLCAGVTNVSAEHNFCGASWGLNSSLCACPTDPLDASQYGNESCTAGIGPANKGFVALNFDTMANSFVTFFSLMMVNRWQIIMDVYVEIARDSYGEVGAGGARFFFLMFYLIVVAGLVNVIIASIVESYSDAEVFDRLRSSTASTVSGERKPNLFQRVSIRL